MANRKLQGEIDRVLKKVDEGVHIFEQIWDKVYSAATTAQKEKYEGDLKKEIKKLQRLRDQIKTWQGDSSIKDKTKLDANRKLIEEKMEKFKVCEKETKTKAFSKEGLAQDRTDPKQKAKANVGDWVSDAIARLTEQCEEMEAEIETLNSGKRRKRNDENPRVTQLKDNISRHEHHQEMLERVLRAVHNDAVSPDEAAELKESVDYYIDCNQEPDFYEDEEMYDMLNLEAAPTPVTNVKKLSTRSERDNDDDEDAPVPPPPPSESSKKKVTSSPRNSRTSRSNSANPNSATKLPASSSRNASPKATRPAEVPAQLSSSPLSSSAHGVSHANNLPIPPSHGPSGVERKTAPTLGKDLNHHLPALASAPLLSSVVRGEQNGKINPAGRPAAPQPTQSNGQILRRASGLKPSPAQPSSMPSAQMPGSMPQTSVTDASASLHPSATVNSFGRGSREGGMFPPIPESSLSGPPIASPKSSSKPVGMSMGPGNAAASSVPGAGIPLRNAVVGGAGSISNSGPLRPPGKLDASSILGGLEEDMSAELAAVEAALEFMPDLSTSVSVNEGGRVAEADGKDGGGSVGGGNASPRNPVKVPSSFPTVAAPVFDSREVFERFDPDTLFFIFYYQQGTYQQYLAASELKRQGWRFHKKYLTWFQRHDEPKVSTDEFETGTFIYFDYANVVVQGQGSGWCQRIKSEFVFEYRYLEDELL